QANGSFSYTPDTNYYSSSAADSFTYRVTDGQSTSGLATVAIWVTAVNDRPIAGSNLYNMAEDGSLTIAAPGVLANDSDVEGSPLTISFESYDAPAHGTVTLNQDGSFIYTPAANFHGIDSFRYRVYDSGSSSNDARVVINVAAVNDGPVAASDNF